MWHLSPPGYLAANLVFSGYHGVAALIAPTGPWRLVGRPLAHAAAEALRLSFPFGGVPLATLGIAQAASPVAGLARVGGVILITWFVLQVGTATGGAIDALRRHERDGVLRAAVPTGLGLVVLAVSGVAPRGHGTGAFLDVAAVQGGGEQGTRADEVPSRLVTQRHLEATAGIAADPELDLVVWPENVVDVARFAGSDEASAVSAESARLGVPIALGVTEDVAGQTDRFTNAQLLITPDGNVADRYDKVRRVPFGEYVPLRGVLESLGAPLDQVPSDAVAGTGPALLHLPDGARLAVVISWEVFFGGRAREGVRGGGAVVMNPTNGASYRGTIVQTQQVASSRLRAVETGRWVVQVAPTGFSAFVTPDGEVVDRTAVGERAVLRHTVELRAGRTWYVALGDAPYVGALVVGLGTTLVAARRQRRHQSTRTRAATDDRDLTARSPR
jgi:apolipoprotein N-acyltransferase